MAHKPEGYSTVSPYLVVEDAEASVAFIASVFGARQLRMHRRDDGTIMHTEMLIEDSVVMLGQAPGGPAAHVHVYVEDPQAVYDRALAAGAVALERPERKEDGETRGGFRDPQGTTWWVARGV